MARGFIRHKYSNGKYRYYLVKTRRIGKEKWQQEVLKYFHSGAEAQEYAEQYGLKFPTKRSHRDVMEEAELDDKIKILWKRYKKLNPSKGIEERLKILYEVESTYHSNSIEGSSLSLEETRSILIDNQMIGRKPLDDYTEAINHKEGIEYIYERAKDKKPPTEKDFKKLNRIILKNIQKWKEHAGEYRKTGMRVIGSEFKRPPAVHVPKFMKRLVASIKENWNLEVGELIASSHADFESIHPFVDGNGRVGRLVLNLILLQKRFPPIIIPKNKRAKYFKALEASFISNNDIYLRKFIKGKIVDALEDYIDQAEET